MLKTQEYLRSGKTLDDLHRELYIDLTYHPSDNRVILNYNQITSPKSNAIVCECRGLVLDKVTYDIIARAFPRFFNLGEMPNEEALFDWSTAVGTYKEDGSLILLYFYNGQWHVNTRGSFASFPVNGMEFTWRDLFFSAFGDARKLDLLVKCRTYVFELCTPYTQVVRQYATPQVYLLSVFDKHDGAELTFDQTEYVALGLNVPTPPSFDFTDHNHVTSYIVNKAKTDKTFEGIVVRDANNNRLKIKSSTYVELHRLSNNGNVAIPRNIAKIILDNEQDEVLAYFPALKNDFENVKSFIDKMLVEADNLYFCHHDEISPRKYALAVGKAKLSKLLFDCKKKQIPPLELVKEQEYKDIIIKIVDKDYKMKLKG